LSIPLEDLREAAEESDADISIQIATNPENLEAVRTLEEQYDALMAGRSSTRHDPGPIEPDADIAAQVEAFLAELEQGEAP
jgi:hypothetical protein